jgi:hypothetical protein
MKYLRLFSPVILLSLLVPSCSGSNGANAVRESTSAISSGASISSGEAGFSCKLDGKEFSASGTDQNINAAFLITSGEDKGSIFFTLYDVNNPAGSLLFLFPGKAGTTTFDPNYKFSLTAYVTRDHINYVDNPLTVTINSITAGGIFGNFSGKYTLSSANAGNAKSVVGVTNGKFEIPFSNSADWKKIYHAE